MKEGILLLDAEQQVVFSNSSAAEILGWPKNELLGKHLQELIPNDSGETSTLVRAVTEKSVLQQYTGAFRSPVGTEIPVECSVSYLEEPVAHDKSMITFHTASPQQEKLSSLKLSFASNNLFGLMYADVDGRIREVNDTLLTMLGYTREELIGKSWKAMTPDEFAELDERAMLQLRQFGAFRPFEKQYFRKNGERVDVLVGPMMGKFTPRHGIIFVVDITGQKLFERMISEGEKMFRAMAESAPELIWVCDTSMKVNYANKKLLDYLHCTLDEFAQMRWVELMHPDDVASTLEFLGDRSTSLANYEFEARVRRPDGKYRWVISRGGPIITETGEHLGWVGSVTDIHDRKMAEEALLRYSKRLEVSNRELEQFATNASHDLQEPLRKVMMFSDHLRIVAEKNLSVEALDDLNRIQRGTRKMQRLIEDLLNLSRVTRRGEAFHKTDLRELIAEVLAELSYNFPDAKSRVTVEGEAVIDADGNQLRQMLTQLLDNALKFHTPDKPSKALVCIQANFEGLCRISVSDDGLGIKVSQLDRIFNTFVRLHHGAQYPGTGIGLALVKKIVERHSGNIRVSSEPGYGSTFTVVLPMAQEDSPVQEYV